MMRRHKDAPTRPESVETYSRPRRAGKFFDHGIAASTEGEL